MWVICIGCHHAVEMKVPRKGTLKCTACGSRVARTVRQIKTNMLNGGQMPPEAARTLTHAALISIARERGYKGAWAAMKFKLIYGSWPEGSPEPENPSGELMWWIKREGKAYARMMREKDGGEWKGKKVRPSKINPTGDVNRDSSLMSEDDWGVDL